MPYIAGTPEAIQARLGRKDSKNFETTCRGINPSTGAQCRRGLSKNANAPSSGIITFVDGKEAFFCWQHKEQAKDMVLRHTSSWQMRRNQQQGRTSLDTLIETVEFKVGSNNGSRRNGKTPVVAATATATAASGKTHTVGLAAVGPEAAKITPSSLLEKPSSPSSYPPFPKPQEPSFFYKLFMCCFGYESPRKERNPNLFLDPTNSALAIVPEGNSTNAANQSKKARRRRTSKQHVDFDTTPMGPPLPHMTAEKFQAKPSAMATGSPSSKSQNRPMMSSKEASQKQSLFSVIPRHLTPKTALLLQQELLKPFSPNDQPGYIYIFWLQDKPSAAVGKGKDDRKSTGPTSMKAAIDATGSNSKGTSQRVLFKIGRAVNVQRRLHQWTEQCNYDLSLVRYYPHVSTSTPQKPLKQQPTNTISQEPRKVPNVNKIERLIHLELRDDPLATPEELSNPCKVCGRKHKEWFSIEASREGIVAVDELVKRWIQWGEDNVDLYNGQTFDQSTGNKLPALAVSPRVDRPAGAAGKKDGPAVAGVVAPNKGKNSRNLEKARRRQDDEDEDWEYRTESDEEEEWVDVARVHTGEKGKKKMQVFRDD